MSRTAVLVPSPKEDKKWRVILPDDRTVDFGQRGAEDFTTHKDPHRMLNFLRRHGGISSDEYVSSKKMQPSEILKTYRKRMKSDKEDWADYTTPGFWSRWLLWSEPSLQDAARRVKQLTGLTVRFERWRGSRKRRTRRRSRSRR